MSIEAEAHGRVNLIGEHVDYAGGLVLPTLIGAKISVEADLRTDGRVVIESASLGQAERKLSDRPSGHWSDLVLGAAASVGAPGLSVSIRSTVPEGAGVSSSAALLIAILRALDSLMGLGLSPFGMAELAQRIEAEYGGTHCGIMDPLVIAAGRQGEAVLIDCRSNATRLVPLFSDHIFAVVHSGESRQLRDGAYNERRQSVEQAARLLGFESLRDADLELIEDIDDPTVRARARHVVSEIKRVELSFAALRANQPRNFGVLMNASHASLQRHFEVSTPVLDRLVRAMTDAGAFGARLTGAGFGGCAVALVPADQLEPWWEIVSARCSDAWLVDPKPL